MTAVTHFLINKYVLKPPIICSIVIVLLYWIVILVLFVVYAERWVVLVDFRVVLY